MLETPGVSGLIQEALRRWWLRQDSRQERA